MQRVWFVHFAETTGGEPAADPAAAAPPATANSCHVSCRFSDASDVFQKSDWGKKKKKGPLPLAKLPVAVPQSLGILSQLVKTFEHFIWSRGKRPITGKLPSVLGKTNFHLLSFPDYKLLLFLKNTFFFVLQATQLREGAAFCSIFFKRQGGAL